MEQLPRIGDVAGATVAPGGALVGPVGIAYGPMAPLPRPLAPYVHICHHFGPFLL